MKFCKFIRCNALLFVFSVHCVAYFGQAPQHKQVAAGQIAVGNMELVRDGFGLVDGAASSGSMLFVPDVKGKKLFSFQSKDGTWQELLDGIGCSGTFFQLGHLYMADNRGAAILRSRPFGKPTVLAKFKDGARPNDLVVDHHGVVYVTMTKEGQVRRVNLDGTVDIVGEGIDSPNGITMSPDGSMIYVSSVKSGNIVSAQLDSQRQVSEFSPFARLASGPDGPRADGMCIDRGGNVYCTGFDSVWVFSPQGKLLQKIATPERPINCTFGGAQGQVLYISTFGGLMAQPVRVYGVAPNPAVTGPAANPKDRPSTELPASLQAEFNVVYYTEGSRKLLCDLFRPKAQTQQIPAIVLVHGGGWLKGDKTKFRPLAIKLANAGYAVMSIEYRLGHETRFPAGIHDCNAATMFLKQNAKKLGIDANRISAVGGSAGGHLVGLMSTGSSERLLLPTGIVTRLDETSASSASANAKLRAAVVMAGPMQIASGSVAERSKEGSESNAIHWIGDSIDNVRDTYLLADAYEKISTDDPPMLFLTGSLDSPARDTPSVEALKSAGIHAEQVIHEGAKHGHWNRQDWMDTVVSDILDFLKHHG